MVNRLGYGTPHRDKMENGERWTGQYLDVYCYPYISKQFKRNNDGYTNERGIDVYLTGGTKAITLDEKCTCLYVGEGLDKSRYKNGLQCISFETSTLIIDEYTNKKIPVSGWLLADTINTHYSMIWIDSADTRDGQVLKGSGLTDCTVAIISKDRLWEYLNSIGWTKEKIRIKDRQVREAFDRWGENYNKHVECGTLWRDGIRFYIQLKAEEHGINIQLSRKKCIEISDCSVRITRDKLVRLK